jgi:hypothetical protein
MGAIAMAPKTGSKSGKSPPTKTVRVKSVTADMLHAVANIRNIDVAELIGDRLDDFATAEYGESYDAIKGKFEQVNRTRLQNGLEPEDMPAPDPRKKLKK